ncbi:hypothetical protein ACGFZA_32960 [Streptomyces sp. NPDC048211]|uniref:hypothetical protein n=1 Tax=Streptomyces sp. NPDC048211 TaxID=3365516 RepID=UPI0037152AF1
MNEVLTLDAMAAPLRALRLLAVDFPHLPAPVVDVNSLYPDRLSLSLHEQNGAFTAFEAWRAALSIDPAAVDFHVQFDGRTGVLNAEAKYAGATIELTAYTRVPTTARLSTAGVA